MDAGPEIIRAGRRFGARQSNGFNNFAQVWPIGGFCPVLYHCEDVSDRVIPLGNARENSARPGDSAMRLSCGFQLLHAESCHLRQPRRFCHSLRGLPLSSSSRARSNANPWIAGRIASGTIANGAPVEPESKSTMPPGRINNIVADALLNATISQSDEVTKQIYTPANTAGNRTQSVEETWA